MSHLKPSSMASSLLLRRLLSTTTTTQSPGFIKSLTQDLYRTRDPAKLAATFIQSSQHVLFRRKTGAYEEVVRRLSIARRYDLIRNILDHQKSYADDVAHEGFCVRLISLYGRSGMLDHALKVFDEMPELKSTRSIMSLNALLSACINSKKFDQVEPYFRDLPRKLGVQPDVVTYNTLIKAFCEMGELDKAVSMLDEMEKGGCKADRVTFNTVLYGLYSRGRFADGEAVWDRMGKCGVVPDIRGYNARLVGLASEKKAGRAVELVEEMKGNGLSPDLFSFNLLIKGYCNEGNLVEAKKWYEELRRNECKPDKVTYGTLVPFVCEKGDLGFAVGLCKRIFRDRCLVDRAVLQRVVDELVKGAKAEEAKEVFGLAKGNNYCDYKLKLASAA